MNTATVSKTDFIKFNVSPRFKALAQKKAQEHGMTLSELGRMLFGSFVSGIMHHDISPKFLALAEEARKNYREGKAKTFSDVEDAISYLHSLNT